MATAAWSAKVLSHSNWSCPIWARLKTARTPTGLPLKIRGWPANATIPSALAHSDRRIAESVTRSSVMSIGVPVPPTMPTFQTFSGMRRKSPVSRVQSSPETWIDRPALASRWRQRALVWALGSHGAGRRADVTGGDQPDACERDPGLAGQPVDDALQHEIDRSRFGDRERNRLECSRFHGVSDTPDRLVAQRDSWSRPRIPVASQVVRRSAS